MSQQSLALTYAIPASVNGGDEPTPVPIFADGAASNALSVGGPVTPRSRLSALEADHAAVISSLNDLSGEAVRLWDYPTMRHCL